MKRALPAALAALGLLVAATVLAAPAQAGVTNPADNPHKIIVKGDDGNTYVDGQDTLPGYDDEECTYIPGAYFDFDNNRVRYADGQSIPWTEWDRATGYKQWLAKKSEGSTSTTSPTKAPATKSPATTKSTSTTKSTTTKSSNSKSSTTTSKSSTAQTGSTSAPTATAAPTDPATPGDDATPAAGAPAATTDSAADGTGQAALAAGTTSSTATKASGTSGSGGTGSAGLLILGGLAGIGLLTFGGYSVLGRKSRRSS